MPEVAAAYAPSRGRQWQTEGSQCQGEEGMWHGVGGWSSGHARMCQLAIAIAKAFAFHVY